MSHWDLIAATRWNSFVRRPREQRGSKAFIGHAIIATRVRLGSEQRERVTLKPYRYRPAWAANRFINRTTPASLKTSIQGENNLAEPPAEGRTHRFRGCLVAFFFSCFLGLRCPLHSFSKRCLIRSLLRLHDLFKFDVSSHSFLPNPDSVTEIFSYHPNIVIRSPCE